MCQRERNNHSHLVVVYLLLDKYKAYGSLIVIKGTPRNMCLHGEVEHQIRIYKGWSVWELTHNKHWKIPPRNESDRDAQ